MKTLTLLTAITALASATVPVVEAQSPPQKPTNDLTARAPYALPHAAIWCHWRGEGCGRKVKREPTAGVWCFWRGEGCGKVKAKREAEPVPVAEAEAEPGQWCFWRGEGCGKKVKREVVVVVDDEELAGEV